MIKNNKKNIIKLSVAATLLTVSAYFFMTDGFTLAEQSYVSGLKGKVLLQVEENGEAWYVNPSDNLRYYLGRPNDAFSLMRSLGLGVTNEDLKKIPIAEANFNGLDTDEDGLPDVIENSLETNINQSDSDNDGYSDKEEILNHYNPLGEGQLATDNELSKRLAGKILLQSEQNGEAWYVNPDNLKRYYLGRPTDAFNLMRELGLGITNNNLVKINKYEQKKEYNGENIVKNYTRPVQENNNQREFSDPDNQYSFEYPKNWRILKYEENPEIVQITDCYRDYITEKKGAISLQFLETPEDLDIELFNQGKKEESSVLSSAKKIINDLEAYENSYDHELAYEKTTTIKIAPKKFIRISLATAKKNNDYYNKIYDELLESLEFE